jgi:hypothetical protein
MLGFASANRVPHQDGRNAALQVIDFVKLAETSRRAFAAAAACWA